MLARCLEGEGVYKGGMECSNVVMRNRGGRVLKYGCYGYYIGTERGIEKEDGQFSVTTLLHFFPQPSPSPTLYRISVIHPLPSKPRYTPGAYLSSGGATQYRYPIPSRLFLLLLIPLRRPGELPVGRRLCVPPPRVCACACEPVPPIPHSEKAR